MKTTNALMAAALAGVFAAGTALTQANVVDGSSIVAEEKAKEKEKCPSKDKEKCPSKDKEKCPAKEEKKEGTIL